MKKTKIKQRFTNAAQAFFESEPEETFENGLVFAGESSLLKQKALMRFNENGDLLVKILKRGFIFFPGAIYVFFLTLMIFTLDVPLEHFFSILIAFVTGSFMTIFGIGNVKNPKHFVIPVSIVAVGVAAVSFFATFGASQYLFLYGIYFFPFALTAPFLAKSWVDNFKRNSSDV